MKYVLSEKALGVISDLKGRKSEMLEMTSWCHLHDNGDANCVNGVPDLSCVDSKASDSGFTNGEMGSVGDEFCTDEQNLCQFQLPDISTENNDLEFFRNERVDDHCTDLYDYGWPDIENFEDVDQIFRTCETTFGQGTGSAADDTSWFSPSPHAINSSDDAFKLGFNSRLETDPKFSSIGECPPCNNYEQNNVSSTLDSWASGIDESSNMGFYSYNSWLDVDRETKGVFASKEQANGGSIGKGNEVSPTHLSNGSCVTECRGVKVVNTQKQPKRGDQSEGKRKLRASEYSNGSLMHGNIQVEEFENSKVPPKVLHTCKSYMPGLSVNCYSDSRSISCVETESHNDLSLAYKISSAAPNTAKHLRHSPDCHLKSPVSKTVDKIRNCHQRTQLQSLSSGENHELFVARARFNDQDPVQRRPNNAQDEVGDDSEAEEIGGDSTYSPTVQESSSCISSVRSNGLLLEAASFRQLQDVMEQLDIKTKLCIRDSLYRLARSAERRHMRDNGTDRRDQHCGAAWEESNKCMGLMDVETNTNPIDRSIAHLLFCKPSDPSLGTPNDASSHESRMPIHGALAFLSEEPNKVGAGRDVKRISDHE